MQMPMPQKGARASPSVENRHGSFAIITAAATLVPLATRTALPFTLMEKPSLNDRNSRFACQVLSEFHRRGFRRSGFLR
jgi:hypothetical protein